MDGVDQLNNILIIGMTNRIDMIDEALLRPGRLEVHMEISLPDEHGRYQILTIHTAKMRTNGVMDGDVDLKDLAKLTKNFSGAEIGGLVKSATSFAFNRHVKVGTIAGISSDVENLRVNAGDFANALEEVHPAFGVSEEELAQVIQNGIIHYDTSVDVRSLRLFLTRLTPHLGIATLGPALCGAGAYLDAYSARQSPPSWATWNWQDRARSDDSTSVRIPLHQAHHARQYGWLFRSTEDPGDLKGVCGQLEEPDERCGGRQHRASLGLDARGPTFFKCGATNTHGTHGEAPPKGKLIGSASTPSYSDCLTLHPQGRRLLVIATSSLRPMLTDVGLASFDAELRVPPITDLTALDHVLEAVELFRSPRDRARAVNMLRQAGMGPDDGRLSIGVKRLLSVIEMARQEPEAVAERLTSALMGLGM